MVNFFWLRRHILSRMEVDNGRWKHPRPPADPRLIFLTIGLAWISFVQTFFVRPPNSVSARAFTDYGAIAVAFLVALCCLMHLHAAFCRSQYSSWGWEAASCTGFAGQSAIQLQALVVVQPDWWASLSFAWSTFWGFGCAVRAFILIRRLW